MSDAPDGYGDLAAAIRQFRANVPAGLIATADHFVKELTAMLPGADRKPRPFGVVLLAVLGCILEDYNGDGGLAEVLQYAPGLNDNKPQLKDVLPLVLALAGQHLYEAGQAR